MDPFRGAALDELDGFGDGHGSWQGQEHMDMILWAADGPQMYAVFLGDSHYVGVKTWSDIRTYPGMTSGGREYAMEMDGQEGVCHERYFISFPRR